MDPYQFPIPKYANINLTCYNINIFVVIVVYIKNIIQKYVFLTMIIICKKQVVNRDESGKKVENILNNINFPFTS